MKDGDLTTKMLWVLKNARVHAADPGLRSASGFAAGGGRARAVHRAQVGRWEDGTVDVTYELVRRYETVLGLPEGQLLTAMDIFSRALVPSRASTPLHPKGEPDLDETLELIELAFSDERMGGRDWDRLSANLDRMPHALIRLSDWEHLVRRCSQEMGISLDLDFAQRYSAAVRFVRHPRSGPVVAELAADVLRDPGAQLYADFASVLRYTTHPVAVQVLLAQMRSPTNDHALRSALLAMTSLVAGGRLGPDITVEATRLAIEHLRDTSRAFRVRRGAASLVRAVDLPGRHRLAAGLTVDNQKFAASIILAGRSRGADELRELQARVRRSLERVLSAEDQHEPVLTTVLAAATGDANEETNGNALGVLMLSPQGRVVGMTYADELVVALEQGDLVAAHECLTVLSWVMQPECLEPLTEIVCNPIHSADVAYEAATAVGNCREAHGPARLEREQRLVDQLVEVIRTGADDSATESRLRGLTYALGMRARYDLLEELDERIASGTLAGTGPEVGDKARSLFAWWTDLPAHIRPTR